MVNSVRAVIDRKHRFVAALFVFMELLDFLSRSGMEVTMKKREFQKKVTAQLFKKLVEVCAELGENPNITVSSKFNSSYFKLRNNYNLIQISVKQTGQVSLSLNVIVLWQFGQRFPSKVSIPQRSQVYDKGKRLSRIDLPIFLITSFNL